jgi:hypothetical protein
MRFLAGFAAGKSFPVIHSKMISALEDADVL